MIVERARRLPGGSSIASTYERVTFEKSLRSVKGKPPAKFFYPGHPVVDAAVQLVLDRCGENLTRGATLVNESDPGTEPHVLALLEHTIHDGRKDRDGENRLAGRRMQFVEVSPDGTTRNAGFAPHLDYRPISDEERCALRGVGALQKDARTGRRRPANSPTASTRSATAKSAPKKPPSTTPSPSPGSASWSYRAMRMKERCSRKLPVTTGRRATARRLPALIGVDAADRRPLLAARRARPARVGSW
jgi:hypothetical protein